MKSMRTACAFAFALALSLVLTGPTTADDYFEYPGLRFLRPCGRTSVLSNGYIFIPEAFQGIYTVRHSQNDLYYYPELSSGLKGNCNCYVIDVHLNWYSNSYVDDNGKRYWNGIRLSGRAFDLPSSETYGGYIPAIGEDCGRFLLHVEFYEKKAGESSWTFLKSADVRGFWDGARCLPQVGSDPTYMTTGGGDRPKDAWDKIRVAVRVSLRELPQRAMVIAEDHPFPPE
jgi:hypothetical protein